MKHQFFISILLILGVISFFTSCEKEDDGTFTPPVIFVDDNPVDSSFTIEDPCLSTGCALYTLTLPAGSDELAMEFYSSYDILRQDAVWGTLKSAIIVVHGDNRNANEYFSWMANAVLSMNKQNEVVFIAPHFKTSDDVGGNNSLIYWSSNGWKRGFESNNITSTKFSSYDIVDTLVNILADKTHFPFMENIIVTGHSSGAQFTDLYAAASPTEDDLGSINFNYIVANSQYFFYPGPERYNTSSNQYTIPSGCANYTNWPYGTDAPTNYMSRFTDSEIEDRYVNRKITYLLGSLDILTGGSLNTNDCAAVLLGENRFDRGEKMFNYMENFYAGIHNHKKTVVNNVGHNASEMYNSPASLAVFKAILGD